MTLFLIANLGTCLLVGLCVIMTLVSLNFRIKSTIHGYFKVSQYGILHVPFTEFVVMVEISEN